MANDDELGNALRDAKIAVLEQIKATVKSHPSSVPLALAQAYEALASSGGPVPRATSRTGTAS